MRGLEGPPKPPGRSSRRGEPVTLLEIRGVAVFGEQLLARVHRQLVRAA
jgi:hypothetical protein